MTGQGGNDRMWVIAGNPDCPLSKNQGIQKILKGGAGDDRLTGTFGPDRLTGGPGFDLVNGGLGRGLCFGERTRRCESP